MTDHLAASVGLGADKPDVYILVSEYATFISVLDRLRQQQPGSWLFPRDRIVTEALKFSNELAVRLGAARRYETPDDREGYKIPLSWDEARTLIALAEVNNTTTPLYGIVRALHERLGAAQIEAHLRALAERSRTNRGFVDPPPGYRYPHPDTGDRS